MANIYMMTRKEKSFVKTAMISMTIRANITMLLNTTHVNQPHSALNKPVAIIWNANLKSPSHRVLYATYEPGIMKIAELIIAKISLM